MGGLPVERDGEFEIADICGNLACRKPIIQVAGRGRPRGFCSDVCRRAADRDYKRAKKLVETFERNLLRTRHEVAAYGRAGDAEDRLLTPEAQAALVANAVAAIARAEGVLAYAEPTSSDRFHDELRRLVGPVSALLSARAHQKAAAS